MKLLITTSSLPPGAGISTYVHNLATWMILAGHEVLVCRSSAIQKGDITSYPYRIIDIPVPPRPNNEYYTILQLHKVISEFSPAAIINNDNIYLSNLLPYLPAEIVRLSVVHGYRQNIFSWDDHLMIFHAALLNHEYLDYIVAISTPMKDAIIEKYGYPDEQVKLVFNGVWPNSELESEYSPPDNKPIQIIFAGGGTRTKGADVMLSTARKLANMKITGYQIHWVGNLPAKGKYSRQRLDSIPCVRSIGRLPHEQLQKMLQKSDILVMPSRAEGCPMLLLEAMSKGMATVVSDCSSAMAEIVKRANCGYVIPVGSSKMLTRVLLELITSNTNRIAMAEKAINFYKNNLTMDCCGRNIEELCNKMRQGRKNANKDFPLEYFVPYHRRPYPPGSKLKPASVLQRIRHLLGYLPRKRHINRKVMIKLLS